MDPLTITSTVLGLTAQCLRTAKSLSDLRSKFQNAQITIAAICSEVTVIGASLSHIQNLILKNTDGQSGFKPELEVVFDTAVTGCRVVFAVLNEEVQRLQFGAREDGRLTWKMKTSYLWKEDTMKELLSQLRGQQTTISLLIQAIQIEYQWDVNMLMRNNNMVLQQVAQRTLSLRQMYPKLRVPQSIYDREDETVSLISGRVSTIDSTEFEFDEQIISSRAYRKALASRYKKKPPHAHDDEESVDLTIREENRIDASISGVISISPYLEKLYEKHGYGRVESALYWLEDQDPARRPEANEVELVTLDEAIKRRLSRVSYFEKLPQMSEVELNANVGAVNSSDRSSSDSVTLTEYYWLAGKHDELYIEYEKLRRRHEPSTALGSEGSPVIMLNASTDAGHLELQQKFDELSNNPTDGTHTSCTDAGHLGLQQKFDELYKKYKNVKRYYYEQKAQIEALQGGSQVHGPSIPENETSEQKPLRQEVSELTDSPVTSENEVTQRESPSQ